MSNSTRRRLPMVFRIASALLLVAAVAGQIWHRQPAGAATRTLLGAVTGHCPAAASRVARPTIAGGARALDGWGLRKIADVADPRPTSRCAEPVQEDESKTGNG